MRYLERLPPGTPYPAVAARLRELLDRHRARTEEAPHLYVDATGHGEPAIDLLWPGPYGCWFWTVHFTYGDQRSTEGRTVRLGKTWLVTHLKVPFQSEDVTRRRSPLGSDHSGPNLQARFEP